MAFDHLVAHIQSLGGMNSGAPIDVAKLEKSTGVRLPDVMRWWMSTYGGGMSFTEPVLYDHRDSELGFFMTSEEIVDSIGEHKAVMPAGALPFHDDANGGLLLLMPDGEITQLVPDSEGEVLSHAFPSFATFLLALRRAE
jgi:hypothetical protein